MSGRPIAAAAWLALAASLSAPSPGGAPERRADDGAPALARNGRAAATIVLAADAIASERTAARELAGYLEKITSARFTLVEERDWTGATPAIHVGPTAFAARAGIEGADLGGEAWLIRTVGETLVLTGGRPRGTLHAVYRFLEDDLGVRWWTPVSETVPRRGDLPLPALDRRGDPVFDYRDLTDIAGHPEFSARNRLNGHWSMIPWSHGGRVAHGPPYHVHTFNWYVPADEFFEPHPEYFSERDGERTAARSQLCLTNRGLLGLFSRRLREFIEEDRRRAAVEGQPPSRLYDISPNDWSGTCECAPCRGVVEEEGSKAGPLLRFVNELARDIESDYPDVSLTTLAYIDSFRPPSASRPRDNVVVRLSALHRRDFSKPVTHRRHRGYVEALDGWAAITKHLWVWDYSVSYGKRAHLPLPNLGIMARDFRTYRDRGVSGLFIENEYPILEDMRELKVWVLAKLLEDPDRDPQKLIQEFTRGYYGEAHDPIDRYLRGLLEALERRPSRIRYLAEPGAYDYLTAEFLYRSQCLFDEAESRVDGAEHLQRVRFARLSLDRATLLRWSRRLERISTRGARRGQRPLDPQAIAERYRDAAYAQIERRFPNGQWERRREKVDRDVRRLLRDATK